MGLCAATAAAQAPPSVLFMISETSTPGQPPAQWWSQRDASARIYGVVASTLARAFSRLPVSVLHPSGVKSVLASGSIEEHKKALELLGKAAGADFIVVGTAKARPIGTLPQGAAMQVRSDISLKVFSVKTGNWIASAARSDVAAFPLMQTAVRLSLQKAGDHIAGILIAALEKLPAFAPVSSD